MQSRPSGCVRGGCIRATERSGTGCRGRAGRGAHSWNQATTADRWKMAPVSSRTGSDMTAPVRGHLNSFGRSGSGARDMCLSCAIAARGMTDSVTISEHWNRVASFYGRRVQCLWRLGKYTSGAVLEFRVDAVVTGWCALAACRWRVRTRAGRRKRVLQLKKVVSAIGWQIHALDCFPRWSGAHFAATLYSAVCPSESTK